MTITAEQIAQLRQGLQRATAQKATLQGRLEAAQEEHQRATAALQQFEVGTVEELDRLIETTATGLEQVVSEASALLAELEGQVPA